MREQMRLMKRMLPIVGFGILLTLSIALPGAALARDRVNPIVTKDSLQDQVRHQLVMLPFYSVFDNLTFQIESDGTVVLSGEVVRPVLKSDAGNVVARLVGKDKVVNKIEVLPLSSFDDRIRIALYRRIFGNDQLYRYGLGADPRIHIIVKNGNVTLTGVVANQVDKNLATIVANGVPGAFTVTNDLRVGHGLGGQD